MLHELQDTLAGEGFASIKEDIYALRAPPDGTSTARSFLFWSSRRLITAMFTTTTDFL